MNKEWWKEGDVPQQESLVYQCKKCSKRMKNDPESIKLHDSEFCKPKRKIRTTNASKKTSTTKTAARKKTLPKKTGGSRKKS
jgi:hypothetical protein